MIVHIFSISLWFNCIWAFSEFYIDVKRIRCRNRTVSVCLSTLISYPRASCHTWPASATFEFPVTEGQQRARDTVGVERNRPSQTCVFCPFSAETQSSLSAVAFCHVFSRAPALPWLPTLALRSSSSERSLACP